MPQSRHHADLTASGHDIRKTAAHLNGFELIRSVDGVEEHPVSSV